MTKLQVTCEWKESCSGCSEWDKSYETQVQNKVQDLGTKLKCAAVSYTDIEIRSVAPFGLRDHFDFTIEQENIGLYSHSKKSIIDIPNCLQLSKTLQEFYSDFRKIYWPIKKGSVRLRISPSGQRGAWLDFANLDVKALFDEEKTLRQLLQICHVEIGQRKKVLKDLDKLKLFDPELQSWSQTWQAQKAIPLYGTIASFTQSGDLANQIIISEISKLVQNCKSSRNIIEYGCGNGNITFSLLSPDRKIIVIEKEALSLQGLQKTAAEQGTTSQLTNYSDCSDSEKLQVWKKSDLLIANPPRSGFSNFLLELETYQKNLPANLIYMSCFPDSFCTDAQKLCSFGYQNKKLLIIDQFPQTKHYEVLSLWLR